MIPAAGVICLKGDEVLLIRRGKPPKLGEWSLPGGRVEPGENTRETALRELSEETGVYGDIMGLADIIEGRFGGGHDYLLIDYAVRWTTGEVQAGDDAAEAAFFKVSEISSLQMWSETIRVIKETYERFA